MIILKMRQLYWIKSKGDHINLISQGVYNWAIHEPWKTASWAGFLGNSPKVG